MVKINWRNLKIFSSRNTEPIWTKLGTKHPWMKGIQVCSNEGPRLFPRGDNYEIVKIHWRNWKNLLLQNHWANLNQTWHKASWVKGIQVCSNEEPAINSPKINDVFFSSLNQRVFIDLNCFHRWAMWPMGLLFKFGGQRSRLFCRIVGKRGTIVQHDEKLFKVRGQGS